MLGGSYALHDALRARDELLLGLSSGDGDVMLGQRTILRGSGGIFFGIVVALTSSGAATLCKGLYCLMYVCM